MWFISTFSVIYVDMKWVTPRVGHADWLTDGQSDQGLWFQELLCATKNSSIEKLPVYLKSRVEVDVIH